MSKTLTKSRSGFVWFDVTDKARQILESKAFELFHVWTVNGRTYRMPIPDEQELNYALLTPFPAEERHRVCIEIGDADIHKRIEFVTLDSWSQADKILHEGFIYVRYSDLTFCK